MQIAIEQLPPMRVAAVRQVEPYTQIGKAFAGLGRGSGTLGVIDGLTAPFPSPHRTVLRINDAVSMAKAAL